MEMEIIIIHANILHQKVIFDSSSPSISFNSFYLIAWEYAVFGIRLSSTWRTKALNNLVGGIVIRPYIYWDKIMSLYPIEFSVRKNDARHLEWNLIYESIGASSDKIIENMHLNSIFCFGLNYVVKLSKCIFRIKKWT